MNRFAWSIYITEDDVKYRPEYVIKLVQHEVDTIAMEFFKQLKVHQISPTHYAVFLQAEIDSDTVKNSYAALQEKVKKQEKEIEELTSVVEFFQSRRLP